MNKVINKNPYYIVAPSYVKSSAGISLLYQLCDTLNRKGYKAYIILSNKYHHYELYNYELHNYIAPLLSHHEAWLHTNHHLNPIVIHTDTGYNILHFPCTFRYLMNYIGIFPNEPKETDLEFQINKKYFWAFSQDIADKHHVFMDRVMFTPIVDTEIFYPPTTEKRAGKMCYLGKYSELHSNTIPKEAKDFYIFYRSGNTNVPSREEYAEKLRNAECLYVYENTSVITEALMCGCPVVCIPNPYCSFTETDMIGFQEVGLNGIAIGTSEAEIARAKTTVHLARPKILALIQEFDSKIDHFIDETQNISHETTLDITRARQSLDAYFKTTRNKNKILREIKRIFLNISPFKVPYVVNKLMQKHIKS